MHTCFADLDEFDDDELQELADADMDLHDSQQLPVQAHKQPQTQVEAARPTASPAAQGDAQTHTPGPGKESGTNGEAPQEDVMLDDDELIELACASLSEEASKASEQRASSNAGDQLHTGTPAPLDDTLDDEELLALAVTQLDEA